MEGDGGGGGGGQHFEHNSRRSNRHGNLFPDSTGKQGNCDSHT